jgi:large subunit ribosomal protein L23
MIVKYPLLSEKAVGLIERDNKLVFMVESTATKPQIKKAVEDLYKIKVSNITTAITMEGTKKAYVRLAPEFKASDLAAKLKIL